MPKPKPNPSEFPVTVVALSDLTPYPKNPRHITPAAVNAVAESLQQFGWQQPIVIDPKRVIVAGHTRHQAALQLGWLHAPTVTIAAKHARAYRLADNRSGEFSTWDLDVLPGELAALPSGQLEALPALDFSAIVPLPVEGQTDPDDIPEAPKPRTKLGDVWTLGDHRLMCGDCTKADDVDRLLNSETLSMVVTSPPYNIGIDRMVGSGMHKKSGWVKKATGGFEDRKDEAEYQEEQRQLLTVWHDRMHPGSAFWYNHKNRMRQSVTHSPLEWLPGPFSLRQEIIWRRSGAVMFNAQCFPPNDERLYWLYRAGSSPAFNDTREVKAWLTVWEIHQESNTPHAAPFPVELPRRCIVACSQTGETIGDPYAGSGTTIIAAEREKRRCYAMEIAPKYVDVAVARWEAFTGRTATRG